MTPNSNTLDLSPIQKFNDQNQWFQSHRWKRYWRSRGNCMKSWYENNTTCSKKSFNDKRLRCLLCFRVFRRVIRRIQEILLIKVIEKASNQAFRSQLRNKEWFYLKVIENDLHLETQQTKSENLYFCNMLKANSLLLSLMKSNILSILQKSHCWKLLRTIKWDSHL